ncbi:Uncharacterized protein Fot_05362 [Forsythia ovata]|uniref:Uncharacterized protein n=1 Tax=Forsythia ovata TaxID=205694 RepID=A0ABD1WPY9_9LAMI
MASFISDCSLLQMQDVYSILKGKGSSSYGLDGSRVLRRMSPVRRSKDGASDLPTRKTANLVGGPKLRRSPEAEENSIQNMIEMIKNNKKLQNNLTLVKKQKA